MQNFRALGAQTPVPPAAGGFAPRPPKQPPIANFWLRACKQRSPILSPANVHPETVLQPTFNVRQYERSAKTTATSSRRLTDRLARHQQPAITQHITIYLSTDCTVSVSMVLPEINQSAPIFRRTI